MNGNRSRVKKKRNLITFQFKLNQTISLYIEWMDGQSIGSAVWTWIGSLLPRAHHVSLCHCWPMFIQWKINFKMMQLGTQCSLTHSSLQWRCLVACCSRRYSKYWSISTLFTAHCSHVQIDFTFEFAFNGFCLWGKWWFHFMVVI